MSILKINPLRSRWIETLVRLVWVVLAAMHVAPLWRTAAAVAREGATLTRLGVLALLVLFLAFFILKAVGVHFLQVRCRKMSLVAFLVCAGMIHGEDATRWAKDPAHQAVAWSAVAGAGAMVVAAPAVRRRVRGFIDSLNDLSRAAILPATRVGFAVADAGWRSGPAPGRCTGIPRGPPAFRL